MSTGSVQGEAANKYPEFRYRLPLKPPSRISLTHEYPMSKPFFEPLRYVELADYQIKASANKEKGFGVVEVWLVPNKYSPAKKPRMIFKANITMSLLYDIKKWPEFEHKIIKDAFT